MKTKALASCLVVLVSMSSCQTVDESAPVRLAQATLRQPSGLPAGTAQMFRNGDEITISITMAGLSPGTHGVHLHTVGRCDAPDFTSAGSHLNPTGRKHGHENPDGAHLGDLPNVIAGPDGSGTVSAVIGSIPQQALANVFDSDGTAIVVHAGADDYRTDPSGNSGVRIACGVLARS